MSSEEELIEKILNALARRGVSTPTPPPSLLPPEKKTTPALLLEAVNDLKTRVAKLEAKKATQ